MSPPTAVPPVTMPAPNRQPAGNIAFMMMAARPNNNMRPPAVESTPEMEVAMEQPGRRRNANGGIEAVIRDEEASQSISETLREHLAEAEEGKEEEEAEEEEDDIGEDEDDDASDAMDF